VAVADRLDLVILKTGTSSLSDVPGPLPNIGAFAGGPAVPEPSSFVELGTGLLMLVGAWVWRRDRTRPQQHRFQIPRHAPASSPLVSSLFVGLILLATIPAPVPAGTITIDDLDQQVSISSTRFDTTSISYTSVLQQATFQGVFFITAPGGLFDVAAYLRGQQALDVPTDLSVLVAAASVPEPSSLTLCGVAALIGLGVALRHRSGVRSAGRLLLDRSRLHKK
jgi:hypothetical protein